jgi:hypothetical protein
VLGEEQDSSIWNEGTNKVDKYSMKARQRHVELIIERIWREEKQRGKITRERVATE